MEKFEMPLVQVINLVNDVISTSDDCEQYACGDEGCLEM